ncbi:MAG: hypothetical protein E6I71_08880, partial [Chloroflexi bacterium]
MPRGHRLIVGAAAEEIDQRDAGVDERRHRLLIRVRRRRRDALPFRLREGGDPVRKPAAVQLLERDRGLERRQDLAELVEVEARARLERESGPLDRDKRAAAQVGIEIARALEHGEDRPDHSGRLSRAFSCDAGDQLAAVEHSQPLDRAELGHTLDECRHLVVVGPVGRG